MDGYPLFFLLLRRILNIHIGTCRHDDTETDTETETETDNDSKVKGDERQLLVSTVRINMIECMMMVPCARACCYAAGHHCRRRDDLSSSFLADTQFWTRVLAVGTSIRKTDCMWRSHEQEARLETRLALVRYHAFEVRENSQLPSATMMLSYLAFVDARQRYSTATSIDPIPTI